MNIAKLTLYHYPATRSARVKWLLLELLGEAFDVVRVELYEGEQFEPEFLVLNPNHAVPTLRVGLDDGSSIAMFESGAIIAMLADVYPDKALAPPPSPFSPARADYLQMIHFCGAAIDMILWQMRLNLHILPPAEQHEGTIVRYRAKFADEVEPQLHRRLATGGGYICGEAFCAADCMVAHAVIWARRYGLCADRAFRAYLARIAKRPAFREAFADAKDFTPKVPEGFAAQRRFSG